MADGIIVARSTPDLCVICGRYHHQKPNMRVNTGENNRVNTDWESTETHSAHVLTIEIESFCETDNVTGEFVRNCGWQCRHHPCHNTCFPHVCIPLSANCLSLRRDPFCRNDVRTTCLYTQVHGTQVHHSAGKALCVWKLTTYLHSTHDDTTRWMAKYTRRDMLLTTA